MSWARGSASTGRCCMDLIAKVPPEFTLNARNPERTVKVGGKNTVFVPMYGAPYVRDLDNKRRYGSLEDLNNFHKLAYMSPALHSSSSIICEPMEIPVPKRHLHIIHSALKHSDKPFMGIVTSKERAEDVMKMAGIVFGDDYVKDNTVLVSITNCNSPLVWDATMLDAMKVYARHNQPLILAPFALCGASTSASAVGAVAQVNAEALAGVAFTQLIRPGSPQIYGQFMVTVDMKTGAPMGGTPEAAQMMYLMGALARKYKLPWRTSGFHVGSKLNDAQAGYEANMLMHAAILSGANYIWHVAGWLEAGLCLRLFQVRHRCRAAGRLVQICRRVVVRRFQGGHGGGARSGAGRTFPRHPAHARAFREGLLHSLDHGFQFLRAMVGGRCEGPRHARPRQGARHAGSLRGTEARRRHRRGLRDFIAQPRGAIAEQCQLSDPIAYLPRIRSYYAALGYGAPYVWAHFDDVPFSR